MRIRLAVAWVSAEGPVRSSAFKTPALEWIGAYAVQLRSDYSFQVTGLSPRFEKKPRTRVWLCDRNDGAGASSEETARCLSRASASSTTELIVAVGPPDGWSDGWRERLQPDRVWSFGALTLPHELAAVVAAEQIYRAWSILKGKPYHDAHR